MKKNWIIAIIIFLLASNLTLIATLLINQNKNNSIEEMVNSRPSPDNRQGNGPEGRKFETMLAGDLNLSKEQMEELHSMGANFHFKRKELKRAVEQLKHEYYTQLAVKSPDEEMLHELADSLGNLLAKIVILEYNHYQNIKSICTPEQAYKLDSLGKLHIHKYRNMGYQRRQRYPENKQINK